MDVKLIDIAKYVLAQPDDKPLRMKETNNNDICGCLMVQYGNEVLKLEGPFFCGTSDWRSRIKLNKDEPLARLDAPIYALVPGSAWYNIRTFKDIKSWATGYITAIENGSYEPFVKSPHFSKINPKKTKSEQSTYSSINFKS